MRKLGFLLLLLSVSMFSIGCSGDDADSGSTTTPAATSDDKGEDKGADEHADHDDHEGEGSGEKAAE